ncbi:MAG: SufS family cysteine desulfurase [Candidatus Makana argininalis]
MNYPIEKIRYNFPMISKIINNKNIIYLDNASTSQKPNLVINCINNYFKYFYSSINRSIYKLSNYSTSKIEFIRKQISKFINSKYSNEIIFVKGATEGINIIAYSWVRKNLKPGDNILITEMEHHSNIVPWQIIAKEKKINIKYIPILHDGTLNISKIYSLIDEKTKFFSITQISNVLGIRNNISEIIKKIKSIKKIFILVDGSQNIMHHKVDVQNLNCDFYVFSGHKMYGPSGIGVLYVKKSILENMNPWEGGGSMIKDVNLNTGSIFSEIPFRFEAGSINTIGIVGLSAAIDYIESIGINKITNYENKITKYAIESLKMIPGIILYGSYMTNTSVISFNLGKHNSYDVGIFLDQYGISIRTGNQCAIPLMSYFKVNGMCRLSIAMYTNKQDIDKLICSLHRINNILL